MNPISSPRIRDAAETASLLDFDALTKAIARAALEKDDGLIACPERSVVALSGGATMLSMPAVASDLAIHKLITVAPGNRRSGLPTIQGSMTVFDPVDGRPLLILDGPTVTARRTAAVTMLAIATLAPVGARDVLVIGTGSLAHRHVEALASLHSDWRIRVRGTSAEATARFCDGLRERIADVAPAGENADHAIVITCTTSTTPVYARPARADALIVAVGSFRPTIAEIAPEVVRASEIWVDDLDGARHEAGDLMMADVDWSRVGSLAGLVQRSTPMAGRGPRLFKSVGCAAWDLAAARVAMSAG